MESGEEAESARAAVTEVEWLHHRQNQRLQGMEGDDQDAQMAASSGGPRMVRSLNGSKGLQVNQTLDKSSEHVTNRQSYQHPKDDRHESKGSNNKGGDRESWTKLPQTALPKNEAKAVDESDVFFDLDPLPQSELTFAVGSSAKGASAGVVSSRPGPVPLPGLPEIRPDLNGSKQQADETYPHQWNKMTGALQFEPSSVGNARGAAAAAATMPMPPPGVGTPKRVSDLEAAMWRAERAAQDQRKQVQLQQLDAVIVSNAGPLARVDTADRSGGGASSEVCIRICMCAYHLKP